MRVIGTAGHVDHGKSTLIAALTGVHPDRLKEEQAREMTIELGFGWLTLPGGEEVGIIDVPGHRDFIGNMLAGVGGIDAALLVIAADEGVMPQTREHLAILDLLQISKGVVVLTKTDMVDDAEWLALVEEDIRRALADAPACKRRRSCAFRRAPAPAWTNCSARWSACWAKPRRAPIWAVRACRLTGCSPCPASALWSPARSAMGV